MQGYRLMADEAAGSAGTGPAADPCLHPGRGRRRRRRRLRADARPLRPGARADRGRARQGRLPAGQRRGRASRPAIGASWTRSWRAWPAASRACWPGRSWNGPPSPSWRFRTKSAVDCMRLLAKRTPKVVAGESAVAGLAGLLLPPATPSARTALRLEEDSRSCCSAPKARPTRSSTRSWSGDISALPLAAGLPLHQSDARLSQKRNARRLPAAAPIDDRGDHAMQRRSLLAGAAALGLAAPAITPAQARTEIQFWHAMPGVLGEIVTEQVKRFNDSQRRRHRRPQLQGQLHGCHDRRDRRLPRRQPAAHRPGLRGRHRHHDGGRARDPSGARADGAVGRDVRSRSATSPASAATTRTPRGG